MSISKKIDEQLTFATKRRFDAEDTVEYERWVGYVQALRFVQALIEGSREDFCDKTPENVTKTKDNCDL